jgi:hypothetical protein
MESTLQIAATVLQKCYWLSASNKLARGVCGGKNSMHQPVFSAISTASTANSRATSPSIVVDVSEKGLLFFL